MRKRISSSAFYREYHGHPVHLLGVLLPALREHASDALIWTAGDSSLDNKYWFSDTAPAVPGPYRDLLEPPHSKQDVTYWLNFLLHERHHRCGDDGGIGGGAVGSFRSKRVAAINTAVEATTLNERTFCLRSQDVFIRDNIQPQDVLIVSVGGNDVALAPLPCTIAAIGGLACCVPRSCIDGGFSCGVVPLDDCCCGCGPSLCSCLCAVPPCRRAWVT
jgi:hypothetical protein